MLNLKKGLLLVGISSCFFAGCMSKNHAILSKEKLYDRYDWYKFGGITKAIVGGVVALGGGIFAGESGALLGDKIATSGKVYDATTEEAMDVVTVDAIMNTGKVVSWNSKYPGRAQYTGKSIMALAEKNPSNDIQFVSIYIMEQKSSLISQVNRYFEIRGVKKEGNNVMVWKRPLIELNSEGKSVNFFTKKEKIGFGDEATFKAAREYYQQNKDDMKFTPLLLSKKYDK